MPLDFEKEVADVVTLVPKDYRLASETVPIATSILEEIDRRYGADSDVPLAYHNATHSAAVMRRAVRLANIIRPYIRAPYEDKLFDLAVIAGAAHDYEQDHDPESEPGKNEKESATFATRAIEEQDGALNHGQFTRRLKEGILATTAPMNKETGEILLPRLNAGSHDPIKFDMAFSDINGIAMEGNRQMILDATNLYLELSSKKGEAFSIDGLYDFYLTQASFLSSRLNPGRITSDVGYYFADTVTDVYRDMFDNFNGNIVSAHDLALYIGKHPEVKSLIGVMTKSVELSRIGNTVAELVIRKFSSE